MKPFEQRYDEALADPNVRGGLLPFQRGWRDSRDARIAELEQVTGRGFDELRAELAETKAAVLADWERHLETFTRHAEAAGAVVTRVTTAEEACDRVAEIVDRSGTRVVVKGKSMVSEEIGLNDHLEARGVTAVETDLGEWLLQLAGEHPSHLVMPAIHKRASQIAQLLESVLGRPFAPDDVDAMVRVVRGELRQRFLTAGMGLSGANALVAEGGAVMLVCNEGNNRMSVALPPVHVVTAGIEKLVPTFADAIAQVRLLARSATAQTITTYTSFVTGPRPGQQQHILLLDNGRSAMAADSEIASALGCIRCGACANVCPPYQVVGGHAFGHVYTGAIGLVNTPFHHGIDAAAGPQSLCVSCGACTTVCPADIPLADQILEVRHQVADQQRTQRAGRLRRAALAAFVSRNLFGAAVSGLGRVTTRFRDGDVLRIPALLQEVRWIGDRFRWRSPPAIPTTAARTRLRSGAVAAPSRLPAQPLRGRTVVLFLQCLADRLAPGIAIDTARLLHAMGARVLMPADQHCCGLPAFDAGEWDLAARMTSQTLDVLAGTEDVVTPAPSCLAMLLHHAPRLFRDDSTRLEQARQLHGRSHDLTSYLRGPAALPAGTLDDGDRTPVAVHRFCQSSNALDRGDVLEQLVAELCGAPVVPLAEAEVCCGFGGSVSITAPEVSQGIVERKLDNVDAAGIDLLVTDNPGCILHLRGSLHARGSDVRVLHIAEYLAARLPG